MTVISQDECSYKSGEDNNTEKNVDSGRRPHSFHKGSHVLIETAPMNLGSLGYEFLCVNQIGLRKQR